MEGKKISFGFMKTKKAEKPVIEEKKEYIECIDHKAIKIIGGDTAKNDAPLVIPMKPNTLVTAERLKQIAQEVESVVEETLESSVKSKEISEKDQDVKENETLEQMAVRELLEEATKEIKEHKETTAFAVPIPNTVLEGEKESTLDDYEAVPIQDFGMAMLRGMGWTPNKEKSKYKEPELRPKGLGLGADKVIKENQKKNQSKDNEELSIVKNAFVKITTGKYSGCYGKVVSLDEDNGRVMVDIPIKNDMISLSEFMMQPVKKSEFNKESRVINADAYEEYKKSEHSSKRSSPKTTDGNESSSQKYNENKDKTEMEENIRSINSEKDNSNGSRRSRSRDRNRKSPVKEDKSTQRKTDKKRYSSSDSESSLSDYEMRRKHKKDKKHYSSSDSLSDSNKKHKKSKKKSSKTYKVKRDIDKKRKGKKKKRDKDLSPYYKKCRK